MGNQFRQWAEVYFNENGENVNTLISKTKIFNDFVLDSNVRNWTTNKFTKAMREFCAQCEWIETYQPEELINDNRRRIIKKVEGKSSEMYYLRTVGARIKPSVTEEIKQGNVLF